MRSLIRPMLFMIARLGLLFSVIACLYGQTWHGAAYAYKLTGALDRTGVAIVASDPPMPLGIEEFRGQDIVGDFTAGKHLPPSETHINLGAFAISFGPAGYVLGAYHWFMISAFTIFNGVLMWIYRKRSVARTQVK